jgi:hypothetical protein
MSAPIEELAHLNRGIAQLEADAVQLEGGRRAVAKTVDQFTRRRRYLRLARWFRSPIALFGPWPGAVFAVGPLVVGVLLLLSLSLLFDAWTVPFVGFLFGMVSSAIVFVVLLYHPSDSALTTAIPEIDSKLQLEQTRLEETTDRLTIVNHGLQELVVSRRALVTSDKLKRAMLLDRNWKRLRGNEWEDYLVEVCRALGAKVERTGKSGDQGVDLIVEFGPKRVAVQAKGFDDTYAVSNKAVQEAYAGMTHRGCNGCAVITNTGFRTSARELAASTNCALIGEDEFPDFVMGKIAL